MNKVYNKCSACDYVWLALPGERGWRNRLQELIAPCCGSKYWEWTDYEERTK